MPHSPNEFVTFSKSKKLRYVISDQAHWIKYTHVYNLFMYNQDIYNMITFLLKLRFYNNFFMCTFNKTSVSSDIDKRVDNVHQDKLQLPFQRRLLPMTRVPNVNYLIICFIKIQGH